MPPLTSRCRATGGDPISQGDFDAISGALAIPKGAPKSELVRLYRNRPTHHVRPSVDYSMFFSPLDSRAGEEIKDAQGVVRNWHAIFAQPPVQYRFPALHTAFSEYLDAVVAMLQKLSEIEILRR
jgi:hypothetical protein